MNNTQFLVAPMVVFCDPKVKPAAKALYGLLSGYAQAGRGEVFPKQDTIAACMALSVRQVKRLIGELEAAGYIVKDRTRKANGDFGRNVYSLRGFDVSFPVESAGDTSVTQERPQGTPVSHAQGTPVSHREQYQPDQNQLLLCDEKKKPTKKRFVPPTEAELIEHFASLGMPKSELAIEAMKFVGFYEGKDWMVGKNKMSRWKGSASYWFGNWKQRNPQLAGTQTKPAVTVAPGGYSDPYR